MPAQQIDRSRPFGAMGLTSTMALELRNRLEKSLDRTLSATLTWNYPTVNALVAFLAGDDVAEAATAAPDPVPIGDVAEMSDEDAARALRRG
jgi:myxalamid-type polyketide synthase MxaE and MxaD